jgi:UDPglucose 6-dehydrogenase
MEKEKLSNLKIGIVGVGMVGGSLQKYLQSKNRSMLLYDSGKNIGSMEEVNGADVIFVCVPTPFNKETNSFDLSYVEETCQNIKGDKIIIIKSTVLPGTTEKLQEKYPNHKFIFNPEFLTEATAEWDMFNPERQIIGHTSKSEDISETIMEILPDAPYKKLLPSTEAELVKYFGNTFFAIKVSFANQMYDLCERLGLDYDSIMEAASKDKMIGISHLKVIHKGYRGYGGKCLPKDTKALIRFADDNGIDLKLHKTAEEINNKLMESQKIEDPESFSKRNGY